MFHKVIDRQERISRYFFIVLAVLFVFGLMGWDYAGASPRAEFTMKVGHATAKDAQDEVANFFAKEVERLSGGRIKAPVYNASQLGNNMKMNKDVRSGAQEVLVQPAGFASPYIKLLSVLDLPFLFPNEEVQNKVINSEVTDPFREAARKAGLEIVSYYPAGFNQFVTTFQIEKAKDLKGRKFRIIPSPVFISRFKGFGAIPVPMPLGELYTGLQQGVVEGAEITFEIIERMKFYEVAKYVTHSNHGAFTSLIMVNKRWLDSLPSDLKEAVYDAGRAVEGEVLKIRDKYEQRSMDILKRDAAYSKLPEPERAKLKVAGDVVWAGMKKDPDKAKLIEALTQAIEAASR